MVEDCNVCVLNPAIIEMAKEACCFVTMTPRRKYIVENHIADSKIVCHSEAELKAYLLLCIRNKGNIDWHKNKQAVQLLQMPTVPVTTPQPRKAHRPRIKAVKATSQTADCAGGVAGKPMPLAKPKSWIERVEEFMTRVNLNPKAKVSRKESVLATVISVSMGYRYVSAKIPTNHAEPEFKTARHGKVSHDWSNWCKCLRGQFHLL